MSDLNDLQVRAGAWHRARFPNAQMEHVALKLCSEAGEVADAVIDSAGFNRICDGDVVFEAAQAIVTILVLIDRWHSDFDLSAEVARELDRLMTLTEGVSR